MTPSQAHNAHAGLLGHAGPPLVHDGKTYRARPLDQGAKADLERLLTSRAFAAAALAPPGVRAEALAAVAVEAASGAYGFYGKASEQALRTPAGLLLLAAVLFGCTDEEAFRLVTERPDEVRALLDLAVLEALPEASRRAALAARERAKQEAGEEARPTPPAPGPG